MSTELEKYLNSLYFFFMPPILYQPSYAEGYKIDCKFRSIVVNKEINYVLQFYLWCFNFVSFILVFDVLFTLHILFTQSHHPPLKIYPSLETHLKSIIFHEAPYDHTSLPVFLYLSFMNSYMATFCHIRNLSMSNTSLSLISPRKLLSIWISPID